MEENNNKKALAPRGADRDFKFEGYECVLCGENCMGWGDKKQYGNNPQPLAEGQCCDRCNADKVIPARLTNVENEKITRDEPCFTDLIYESYDDSLGENVDVINIDELREYINNKISGITDAKKLEFQQLLVISEIIGSKK